MSPAELTEWRSAAVEAARSAGGLLADWRDRFTVTEKGPADLVTEADHAAQDHLRGYLLRRFPDHDFLGEEGPAARRLSADDPPTWIIDPIDGTTNYVHDVPLYCTSIGLWASGGLVVGVVYDPRHGEMFEAAKGQGAFLNGRPIRVSQTDAIANALMAVGFPGDMRGKEAQLAWWCHFAMRCRGLRRTGSSALNLAYVAAGRLDATWAMDNKVWDVAGGVVILNEAGGRVTRMRELHFDPEGGETLATNGRLHGVLMQQFAGEPSLPF